MTDFTRRQVLLGPVAIAATALVMAESAGAEAPAVPLAALPIHPRSDWAAGLDPIGPIPTEDVKFLIVHHTLEPGNDYKQGEVPKLLRGIFAYHTGSVKGWPDIAYNFFVDQFGEVWEGRSGSLAGPVAGSATGGNQGFTQLCCFLGDHTKVPPTDAAVSSMSELLAGLADRYSIDTSPAATVTFVSRGSNRWKSGVNATALTISAHQDMSMTECPGAACLPIVRTVIPDRVRTIRGAGVSSQGSAAAAESSSTTVDVTPTTAARLPSPTTPETTTSQALAPSTGVAAVGPRKATESDGPSPLVVGVAVGAAGAGLAGLGAARLGRGGSALQGEDDDDGDDDREKNERNGEQDSTPTGRR